MRKMVREDLWQEVIAEQVSGGKGTKCSWTQLPTYKDCRFGNPRISPQIPNSMIGLCLMASRRALWVAHFHGDIKGLTNLRVHAAVIMASFLEVQHTGKSVLRQTVCICLSVHTHLAYTGDDLGCFSLGAILLVFSFLRH